jgi:glycosyltransferase involved in cell wall biosynthesis
MLDIKNLNKEDYPFISCKMITYGRVEFLEESLHSFLQQDYPEDKSELIIVNDYPLQKLKFNHPQVKIINLDKTFKTIGEKENFATSQCKGDIICQWDDDDLAMPWHLQNVAKYFIPGSDLLHWHRAIFMNMPKIEAITGVGNSGIVFSKRIWESIGGHPLENAGYDMSFVLNIKHKVPQNVVFAEPSYDEASWVYVWGGRGYHMSGAGSDDGTKPNVIERHSQHIEDQRSLGKIPIGDIELNPNWKYDYVKLLKEHVSRFHNSNI